MTPTAPPRAPRSPGQHRLLDRLAAAPGGALPLNALTGADKTQMQALARRGDALLNETGAAWLITPAGRLAQEVPY